jgi:hypothetical protein
MNQAKVTKTGKLKKRLLPAVYFDSSVVIDYWITEGMEDPETESDKIQKNTWHECLRAVREILKSEVRINKMIDIRKKLLYGSVKVIPIVTPLSLLELMEWQAESSFKQYASEAVGTILIQKKSKKEIGDYLKKAIELRKEEIRKQKVKKTTTSGPLEILMADTWLNPSFAVAHSLRGLVLVDIANFNLAIEKTWAEPSAYAYLQLGLSDILHILLAKHLGCKYIASFDSDFKRVKDIIKNKTGMNLLNSPEEILKIL